MIDDVIRDVWSPIDYKMAKLSGRPIGMPLWTGEHARRLAAYEILQDYVDNVARTHLEPPDSAAEVAGRDPKDHREYGDADMLVKTILAGIIGNEQTITVDGAELFHQAPPPPPTGDPLPEPNNAADITLAFNLQTYLRDWSKKVRFGLKMINTERNAITLGDGVYVIGFSGTQNRPTMRVYNPGFYFPVLSDDPDEEFPEKVHIAWQMPPEDDAPGVIKIRRITYEIVADKDDEPAHSYPYAPGKLTRNRCLLSDGIWTLEGTGTVDDLSEARVKWQKNDQDEVLRKFDIGVDFLPVIHLPNTVAEEEHYGRSSLATVLQVLDDIAAADTDLQAASATTGTPVIAISGATAGAGGSLLSYGPGSVLETGDGHLTMMDTHTALDALIKYIGALLERLAINARVAEASIGRVNASQVPSGIALALSFAPMEQMIREMRQVRDEKYPLLLKFVLRFAMIAGEIPAGDLPDVNLVFGSFLPTDRSTIINEVSSLLINGAISVHTAVTMLQNAGLPIDDIAAEVTRIQHQQTQKAMQIAQATGSYSAAADFLGLHPKDVASPPGVPPVAGVLSKTAGTPTPTPTPSRASSGGATPAAT